MHIVNVNYLCFLYTHEKEVKITLSVRFSICAGSYGLIFASTFALHIWQMVVSPWDDVDLWPQDQIIRGFDMSSCTALFFLASTFGLLYLAHGCITMRQCVILHSCSRYNVHHWHWGHINSAFDMTLCPTCKLCLLSRCHSIIVYMGLSHLVHSKYDYRNTTLSFDLEVKFIELLTCNFCLLWHLLTIIGTLVYHHEGKCRVHSWCQYDDDLWPQGQIDRVFFYVALCSGHNFLAHLSRRLK